MHHDSHHPFLAYYQPGYDTVNAGRLHNHRYQNEFSHISVRSHLSSLTSTIISGVVNASDSGHTRQAAIMSALPTAVAEMRLIPWPNNMIRNTLRKRAGAYATKDPPASSAMNEMLQRLGALRRSPLDPAAPIPPSTPAPSTTT